MMACPKVELRKLLKHDSRNCDKPASPAGTPHRGFSCVGGHVGRPRDCHIHWRQATFRRRDMGEVFAIFGTLVCHGLRVLAGGGEGNEGFRWRGWVCRLEKGDSTIDSRHTRAGMGACQTCSLKGLCNGSSAGRNRVEQAESIVAIDFMFDSSGECCLDPRGRQVRIPQTGSDHVQERTNHSFYARKFLNVFYCREPRDRRAQSI